MKLEAKKAAATEFTKALDRYALFVLHKRGSPGFAQMAKLSAETQAQILDKQEFSSHE